MLKHKGRIFAVVCIVLLISLFSVTAFASEKVFTDVQEGEWYYESVYTAYEKGLINGKGNGMYEPESNMTVCEAIKLAACISQLNKNGSVTLKNGETVWYSTYMDYCRDNGIILPTATKDEPGYDDYSSRADEYITRLEFVFLFSRALPESDFEATRNISENYVPDVEETENPYNKAVYKLYRAGILSGNDEKGTFCPHSMIQRSEVAAILVRMTDKTKRSGYNDKEKSMNNEEKIPFEGKISADDNGTVTISCMPCELTQLESLEGFTFTNPYMVAAVTVCAFCVYNDDADNAIEMINYLKGPEALSGVDKQFLKDRLVGKEYLPWSYFNGATPENNYTPDESLTIIVTEQSNSRDEAGYIKLFIKSGGADSKRPIILRQKTSTGEWFVNNYSSLLSGIRTPAEADPWN